MKRSFLILTVMIVWAISGCAKEGYEVMEKSEDPTPGWAMVTNDTIEIVTTDEGDEVLRIVIVASGENLEEATKAGSSLSDASREELALKLAEYLKDSFKALDTGQLAIYFERAARNIAENISISIAEKKGFYWEKIKNLADDSISYKTVSDYHISAGIVADRFLKTWMNMYKEIPQELSRIAQKVRENLEDVFSPEK